MDGRSHDYPGANFEVILYIPWLDCLPKLKLILQRFESSDQAKILEKIKKGGHRKDRTKLRGKSNQKAGHLMIDHGFILRILLEMYKYDKKTKYQFLKAMVLLNDKNKENSGVRKSSLSSSTSKAMFDNFEMIREFLNANFPDLSETDVIQIYSKCIMISKEFFNYRWTTESDRV